MHLIYFNLFAILTHSFYFTLMIKYLDIKIYPSQSLSKTGFRVLMLLFILPAFLIGMYFSFRGAWPVAGFLGLELVLIYLAFKISFISSRASEHITLDEKIFKICYHERNKVVKTINLEPTWLKVQLNNNLIPGRLALTSHGKQNIIGKYLSTEERTIVAEKIKSSLHNWKNRYL